MADRFICIIGIDGSGKTSVARAVVAELARRGLSYRYVHALMVPTLSRPFMAFGRRVLAGRRSRRAEYTEFTQAKRRGLTRSPWPFALYRGLVFLDCLPQAIGRIGWPLATGKRVVADRYIYDTLVNLELNVGHDTGEVVRWVRAYLRVLPAPDRIFLIDVPEEVAWSRKDDVPDITYLRERRTLYLGIAQALQMTVLDGTAPLPSVADSIIQEVQHT